MPSDRALRWSAFGFGLLFTLVVVLGYIPSLNGGAGHVAMSANGEHQMLGLYMIGTADDVTHGLSAVLLLGAALVSARASRLALLVFGCYYAVDAAIYLVAGVIQQHPVMSNVLLNLPHVVISGIMLTLVFRGRTALLAA
jgi:hypothetical protein